MSSSAVSSPMRQAPKPSPRSLLRSIIVVNLPLPESAGGNDEHGRSAAQPYAALNFTVEEPVPRIPPQNFSTGVSRDERHRERIRRQGQGQVQGGGRQGD